MSSQSINTGACGERCLLAHNLLNGLGVILGNCELLSDLKADPEIHNRLNVILARAKALADQVKAHQCVMLSSMRARDEELRLVREVLSVGSQRMRSLSPGDVRAITGV